MPVFHVNSHPIWGALLPLIKRPAHLKKRHPQAVQSLPTAFCSLSCPQRVTSFLAVPSTHSHKKAKRWETYISLSFIHDANSASITSLASQHPKKHTCSLLCNPPPGSGSHPLILTFVRPSTTGTSSDALVTTSLLLLVVMHLLLVAMHLLLLASYQLY